MKRNANAERLSSLFRLRDASGDWSGLLSQDRRRLCRKAIVAYCDFPRSTIYQNQAVRELILKQELVLLERNILVLAARCSVAMSQPEEVVLRLDERIDTLFLKVAKLKKKVDSVLAEIDGIVRG